MTTEIVVMILLWYVALGCAVGALSGCYAGTLLQKVGMAVLAIWSIWEANLITSRGFADQELVVGAIGMAIFATGTIIKTYIWNLRK